MDTYSLLREIADSWVLLAMFGFFIAAAVWAFLPSQSAARQEASMIPLRNDNGALADANKAVKSCDGQCANCVASATLTALKGSCNG